jgi:hypothetical protein
MENTLRVFSNYKTPINDDQHVETHEDDKKDDKIKDEF